MARKPKQPGENRSQKRTRAKTTGTQRARPGQARRITSKEGDLPTKDEILQFISNSPERVGKREIGRAFKIKGGVRIALKRVLAEMTDEGLLAGNRKDLRERGSVPPVCVIEVTGRDADGDLIARPNVWDDDECESPRIILHESGDHRGERLSSIGIGDKVLARIEKLSEPDPSGIQFEASAIKRLSREKRRLLGIFRANPRGGTIEPIDRKSLRSWHVQRSDCGGAKDGDLVRFDLARKGRFTSPQAKILESLGNPDDQRQISLIAVHAHGLRDDFPESVLAATKNLPKPDVKDRTDLRGIPLITIDPADARDHDDAVFACEDTDERNQGGFIVIVAIADVAHYIAPGGDLDREARMRANSVYFPDRVVPMLPEKISNDLCSLRENEDRPCLAIRMIFDKSGEKRGQTLMRGLMRSHAKLSYQDAQAAIDGNPSAKCKPLMDDVLKPLWAAYDALTKARAKREPLDLDLPERRIVLNSKGQVERVTRPERLTAHRLIEEFMIQANVAAAELLEAKKFPVVYRTHEPPAKEKLKSLREFLETLDLKLPNEGSLKPAALNRILEKAKDLPVPDLINEVVLRSQSQAEYNPVNRGHFGLNLSRYAHFTSPIRRYADLVVHRYLVGAYGLGPGGVTRPKNSGEQDGDDNNSSNKEELAKLCQAISDAERRAMAAERETNDRLIAAHLADRVGAQFDAKIAGATRSGLFVRLKETGADGFVPASSLGEEYFAHVEDMHALIGQRSGLGYYLGDQIEVRLIEAIPTAGALRFEILTPPRKGQGGAAKKLAGRKTGRFGGRPMGGRRRR